MSGCFGKKVLNFLRKIVCCGSETNVESKIDCKIDCCATHNGTENSTSIEIGNGDKNDSRKDSPAAHSRRSLRDSPVITSQSSIKVLTPDILHLNRCLTQSPLLNQTRSLHIQNNNNI
jgi:hypothetical protein